MGCHSTEFIVGFGKSASKKQPWLHLANLISRRLPPGSLSIPFNLHNVRGRQRRITLKDEMHLSYTLGGAVTRICYIANTG